MTAVDPVARARALLNLVPTEPSPVPGTQEAGFVVRLEGYCSMCEPARKVVGHLVAIVYRLAEAFVPIYRCVEHGDMPVRLNGSF